MSTFSPFPSSQTHKLIFNLLLPSCESVSLFVYVCVHTLFGLTAQFQCPRVYEGLIGIKEVFQLEFKSLLETIPEGSVHPVSGSYIRK